MAFSPSTLLELRQELEGLNQLKAGVEARIRAIEALLTPFDVGQAGLPFQPEGGTNGMIRVVPSRAIRVREVDDQSFVSTGLRAAILDTLKRHGANRAPDVAKMLTMQGFNNDSKTPLNTRVYNDLWRMSQKGLVTSDDGVFSLKEGK